MFGGLTKCILGFIVRGSLVQNARYQLVLVFNSKHLRIILTLSNSFKGYRHVRYKGIVEPIYECPGEIDKLIIELK